MRLVLASLVALEKPAPESARSGVKMLQKCGQVPQPGLRRTPFSSSGARAAILGAYKGPWVEASLQRAGKGSPPWSTAAAPGPGRGHHRLWSCLWLQHKFPFLLVTTARSLTTVRSRAARPLARI